MSTLITICISLCMGDGNYYPVVPTLAAACGSELNAVALQALCSMLYGAAWSGASLIWDQEHWSMLRQTVTHLAICSTATLPTAYLMHWMEHSARHTELLWHIHCDIRRDMAEHVSAHAPACAPD